MLLPHRNKIPVIKIYHITLMSRRLMSSLGEFESNSILNQIEYTSVCHIWCFTWILIKSYAQLKCLYQWIFSCLILNTRQYSIKLCLLELWQSLPSDYMSPALTAPNTWYSSAFANRLSLSYRKLTLKKSTHIVMAVSNIMLISISYRKMTELAMQ